MTAAIFALARVAHHELLDALTLESTVKLTMKASPINSSTAIGRQRSPLARPRGFAPRPTEAVNPERGATSRQLRTHDFAGLPAPRPEVLQTWREEEIDRDNDPVDLGTTLPEGLDRLDAPEERKVFHSIGRDPGAFCLGTGQRVVFYTTMMMTQYVVADATYPFYKATPAESVDPINDHGMDPNFSDVPKPSDSTEYNTRGFNYFSVTRKLAQDFGRHFIDGDWVLLEFTLPEGTIVEADPELPATGLRTGAYIDPPFDIVEEHFFTTFANDQ